MTQSDPDVDIFEVINDLSTRRRSSSGQAPATDEASIPRSATAWRSSRCSSTARTTCSTSDRLSDPRGRTRRAAHPRPAEVVEHYQQ